MKIDWQEIVAYIRKATMLSIRTGYRSASDHPFVLGMVLFLFLLYKFLPSLFGFLVSSSPVIICTALLLGTLLSFGQPNIPEIEVEEEEHERMTLDISSMRVAAISDDLVVKKDESSSIESHVESGREIKETPVEEANSSGDIVSKTEKEVLFLTTYDKEVRRDEAVVNSSSLLEEEKEEIHSEKKVAEEMEVRNKGSFEKSELHETKLIEAALEVGEYVRLTANNEKEVEGLKVKTDKPAVDSFLDSSLDSSWKLVDSHDASSDSGSDRAESSSPDASMADIIPMLDELHPLLDSEPLQPAHNSIDESDGASEASSQDHGSEVGSVDEEAENPEDEGEEEEAQGEKDGASVAVKWTADDEKNLMDLGTSDLERNQRLENLIAKRRARKNLRFEAEKNLIDLDSNNSVSAIEELSRLLGQIPPLSTARRNPFDLPYDSEECTGLPPIPGSAPSVLLPRRNPFDLPYDQADQSGSLTGEGLHDQEFVAVPQRETLFRRHESFALGASFTGEHRQERREIKWRPYFVTERTDLEETNYAQFQRQLSEKSDSKVSSVPESESISSVADHEYHREILEQELHRGSESEFISPTVGAKHVDRQSQSSEEVDSIETEHEHRESNIGGSHELDDNASRTVGGDTSEVTDVSIAVEEEISHETELSSPISDAAKSEVIEENYNESSSSFSLDIHMKNFNRNIDEESSNLHQTRVDSSKSSNTSVLSVVAESDLHSRAGEVGDIGHVEEPVYDSSPSAIEASLSNISSLGEALLYGGKGSFNSTSSLAYDMQVETSEMGSPSIAVKENIFLGVQESVTGSGSMGEEPVSGDGGLWVASSTLSSVEENESRSREVHEIREDDVIQDGFPEAAEDYNDPIELAISDPAVEQIISSSSSFSTETGSSEESTMDGEVSLRSDGDEKIDVVTPPSDQMDISDHFFSSERPLPPVADLVVQASSDACVEESWASIFPSIPDVIEEQRHEEEKIDAATPPSDQLGKSDHFFSSEKALLSEDNFAAQASTDACVEESQVSILPSIPEETIEDLEHKEENESMPTAGAIAGLTGLHMIEPSVILSDVEKELSIFQNKTAKEIDDEDNMSLLVHVPESDKSSVASPATSIPDVSFTGLQKQEVEEIEGIDDEGFLSELDAVADFHVAEMRQYEGRIEQQCQSDVHFSEVGADTSIHSEVLESFSLLQIPEAKSIENIRLSASEEGSLDRSDFLELVSKKPIHVESEAGPSEHLLDEAPLEPMENLQEVEARSLEDIHMALKHASEGSVEGSPKLVEPKDYLGLQEGEANEGVHMAVEHASEGTGEHPLKLMEPTEVLDLQEVEARSLKDMDMASKHAADVTVEDPLKSLEPKDTSDSQEVAASSFEDVRMALKDASEGSVEGSPKLVEPKDYLGLQEGEASEGVHMAVEHASEGTGEYPLKLMEPTEVLDLQEVEARSLKDMDMASKHAADVTVEGSLKSMEPKDTSDSQEVAASSLEDVRMALKDASVGTADNFTNPSHEEKQEER